MESGVENPPPSRKPPLVKRSSDLKTGVSGVAKSLKQGFRGLQPPKQGFRGLQPPQNRGFGVCNLPKTGVSGFATSPKQGFRGLQSPKQGFRGLQPPKQGFRGSQNRVSGSGPPSAASKTGFRECQNRISGPQKCIDCGAFISQNCIFSAGFAGQKILRFWSSFLVQKHDF